MLITAENIGMTKIGKYKSVVGREVQEVDLYVSKHDKYYLDIDGDFFEINGAVLAKLMGTGKIDFHVRSVDGGILSEYKYSKDDVEMTIIMRTSSLREIADVHRSYTNAMADALLSNSNKVTFS